MLLRCLGYFILFSKLRNSPPRVFRVLLGRPLLRSVENGMRRFCSSYLRVYTVTAGMLPTVLRGIGCPRVAFKGRVGISFRGDAVSCDVMRSARASLTATVNTAQSEVGWKIMHCGYDMMTRLVKVVHVFSCCCFCFLFSCPSRRLVHQHQA